MKECRNRPENIRNRKISLFYIEAVPDFFFQDQKTFFLWSKKNVKHIFWIFFQNPGKSKISMKNLNFSIEKLSIFHWNFWFFRISKNIFSFFVSITKYIYFGLEKKSWGQLRCRKVRSFDFWCFQTDSGTPSWVSSPKTKKSVFLY